jgi:5-methylcytosine-specific restriction protein A
MPTPEPQAKAPSLEDWSDVELAAAVETYLQMLRLELAGKPYNKAEFNRILRAGPLGQRTKASIEFRMQNISATMYDLRMPRIAGYLPAKNVGSSVKARIRQVLENAGIEEFRAYVPTPDPVELEERVRALQKNPPAIAPPGSRQPQQVSTTSTTYVRDPAVKVWVQNLAKGHCEGCGEQAPFLGADGLPYLEVHHVMPLAKNGSDRISNAVALCPNCHRRCHYGKDREEYKLMLYEKIPRLEIEVPDFDSGDPSTFI